MKFNRTLAYGLSCLQHLSEHADQGWIETHHIASAQGLPESYCNKVLQSLVHARLVLSSRGRGFKLAKPLNDISAWEVMEAFTFNGAPPPDRKNASDKLYESLRERVNRMLAGLTLDEVVASVQSQEERLEPKSDG
ncbi:MAG TPA: Rrf2 family transcriptional regulator [Elusimicrobiota bacterium]|nr:Rrf2 family transcriptional regulator [Elusimicrobiota bacterium]